MYTYSDFASLISFGYVLLFLIVAALVAWLVRPWLWKSAALLAVLAAFGVPLVQGYIEKQERVERNRMIAERFTKLCKEKAGEKIYKTVADVHGFLIMRPRKPTTNLQEYLDQYWAGDPYGHSDLEAEKPEAVFLADRREFKQDGVVRISALAGYDFIEMPQESSDGASNGRFLRINAIRRYKDPYGQQRVDYKKTVTNRLLSQYGYDWEDISTPEDRQYWIAGGRMRIIELSTKQIIAERTGYLIDREQGARLGGGIPWLTAQRSACPPFESSSTKAKEFVARVLKPARRYAND